MNTKPAVTDTLNRNESIPVRPRGLAKAWLLGAYTLLTLWGAAYLVLFFTDRLPF